MSRAAWMDQANQDGLVRQSEINEWTYQDKLETLFISQLLFLALTTINVLVILGKIEIVSGYTALYVGFFFLAILFLFWLVRTGYTRKLRDRRYWSKRTFEGDGSMRPAVSDAQIAAIAQQQNALCARGGPGCPT